MQWIVLAASHTNDALDSRAQGAKLQHKLQEVIPQRILLHLGQHIGCQKLHNGAIGSMQGFHRPEISLEQGVRSGDPLGIDRPNDPLLQHSHNLPFGEAHHALLKLGA